MKRLASMVIVMGLVLAGCGGDPPAEQTVETPTATPRSSATTGLPPEFLQCMADQGYAIESADEVHSAPQAVLQACFGTLHDR